MKVAARFFGCTTIFAAVVAVAGAFLFVLRPAQTRYLGAAGIAGAVAIVMLVMWAVSLIAAYVARNQPAKPTPAFPKYSLDGRPFCQQCFKVLAEGVCSVHGLPLCGQCARGHSEARGCMVRSFLKTA